ncbi:type IV toxin-antitoxin system AbiEi family antitoxin domain-containing protein [Micropruina sp.]|uniref:type IV toxin-antitoxin system AbiEi family antitoxin domain-containing protein n=1 Tax=Micropruina sp. TaxID=2737536 RepID=UPI0039E58A68
MVMVRTHELKAKGIGQGQIRRMLRDEKLHRLRRGAYLTEPDQGLARHRNLIAATAPQLGPGAVISHLSAAVLHGLPVSNAWLGRVTYTSPGKGGGRLGQSVHQYRTPLGAGDVETVARIRRTTLARTVLDLARTVPELGLAVAAADAALRKGLSREQLMAQLTAAPRRRGLAQARVVVEQADGGSESAGESVSRVSLWQLGLPKPELQYEVEIDGVRYRADFGWPLWQVLGEFDGKVKYGDLLAPGETAADVVMREKRREALLRRQGWAVVRWTWPEAVNPQRLDLLLRPELLKNGWRPDRV